MTDHKRKDSNKDTKPDVDVGGQFLCTTCGLNEKFHYYGRRPPFAKSYTFLEDVYVAKDPFSSLNERDKFLLLGAECCQCRKVFCQSKKCSIFYAKRFCLKCAFENIEEFPEEMKQEILKQH